MSTEFFPISSVCGLPPLFGYPGYPYPHLTRILAFSHSSPLLCNLPTPFVVPYLYPDIPGARFPLPMSVLMSVLIFLLLLLTHLFFYSFNLIKLFSPQDDQRPKINPIHSMDRTRNVIRRI